MLRRTTIMVLAGGAFAALSWAENVEYFDGACIFQAGEQSTPVPIDSDVDIYLPLVKAHVPPGAGLRGGDIQAGPGKKTLRVHGRCKDVEKKVKVELINDDSWPNPNDVLDRREVDCDRETQRFTADFEVWCTVNVGLTTDTTQVRGPIETSGEEDPITFVKDGGQVIPYPGYSHYWKFFCSDRQRVEAR